MGKITIVSLFVVLSVGLIMALSSHANADIDEDDEVCSPGFTCAPGDDEELCPEGKVCECVFDDDEFDVDCGLPDSEVRECEVDDSDDGDGFDDGVCLQDPEEGCCDLASRGAPGCAPAIIPCPPGTPGCISPTRCEEGLRGVPFVFFPGEQCVFLPPPPWADSGVDHPTNRPTN